MNTTAQFAGAMIFVCTVIALAVYCARKVLEKAPEGYEVRGRETGFHYGRRSIPDAIPHEHKRAA